MKGMKLVGLGSSALQRDPIQLLFMLFTLHGVLLVGG
jgi:hypothetical protein